MTLKDEGIKNHVMKPIFLEGTIFEWHFPRYEKAFKKKKKDDIKLNWN